MFLEVSQLDVHYPGRSQAAVRGVSFGLRAGEIGVLIGPSGCGKTTLLRAVAGLERVTAGEIRLSGAVVSSASRTVAPEARRIGMVFQDYALFPHLDVGHNVGFGIHAPAEVPACDRAWPRCSNWWAWAARRSATPMSSPAGSSNAWRWPARWRPNRTCCCSTSPFPTSTSICASAWPMRCAPS